MAHGSFRLDTTRRSTSSALVAITKPLGIYLLRVLDPEEAVASARFLGPGPGSGWSGSLTAFGACRSQVGSISWKQYANRDADLQPCHGGDDVWGPAGFRGICRWHQNLTGLSNRTAMTGDLAFDTAASFTTNTNWQSYGGENTMTYFSQMVALASHNFFSAAVGIAVAAAVIRGHRPRASASTIGNFWRDLVRLHLYLLLPICMVLRVVPGQPGDDSEFPCRTQP